MKRQTILKSTLFLLMAMVCHVAWAQTTYVVSAETGSFNAGWASEWTYNTTTSNPAQLKLITTNGAANMQGSGGEMYLYTGSAAEKTCTYRLSVELPYKIVGYSFKYQDKGSSRGKTITINGTQYTVDETVRNLGMSGINTRSTEFTLSGENERVTFTDFQVLIQTVPTVTMYYEYTYSGMSYRVACLAEVGESYPAHALPHGLSTTTAAPSGTVQNSDNGRTFAFACTSTIPFEYASSYSGITKWYYIRMHSNDKKYIEYISNGNYLEWSDAALPTSGSTDAYAWAFVGNPFDGFKLYNRQVGSSKAVASTGSGEASMTANGTTFTLCGSKETSDTDYFCLKTPWSNFLNAQNGKVNHWGDNDAGSTLLLSSAPLNVGSKFTSGSVTYDVTNSTNRQVEVDDVSDAATSIDIPASVTYDGVTYNVTSIGNDAFQNCSALTSVSIPNSVTSIGSYAFRYCSSLTSVTIPSGVTSIGECAFEGCSSLTAINIPSGVAYINSYTFKGCSSLTEIRIPASVINLHYESFMNCTALTNVIFAEGSRLEKIYKSAFCYCSALTSITIPEGVTSIGDWAFEGCSNLKTVINLSEVNAPAGSSECGYLGYYATMLFNASTGYLYVNENYDYDSSESYPWHAVRSQIKSVEFGPNVTSIGYAAFAYCSSLASINIPEGVTSIEDFAFYECSSLVSITIPANVESIGEAAFYGCSSLTNITIPESVTSIGDYAFYECSSLTNITIPESVTSIGEAAFAYCSSLTNITIPEGVTSIGYGAFSYCSSLTSITIPSGVTSIGDYAFYGCSSLVSITIPANVESIGEVVFYGCSSLVSINIPEGVTSIGEWTFAYCSSLTNITIPEGVTSIGDQAFNGCSNLKTVINRSRVNASVGSTDCGYLGYYATTLFNASTGYLYVDENYDYDNHESYPWHAVRGQIKSVEFGSNVTSIGALAFYNCSRLTSITLPEGVTSIGNNAFRDCSSLTSITIPEGVTSIGEGAFYDCSALTSVSIPNSVTSIGEWAFAHCSLTSITIPEGVTIIEGYTFCNCSSLTSINIPEGVTSIGEWAFAHCSLTSINIPNGVTSIEDYTFYCCSSLESITIHAGITSIGENAFYGCSRLGTVINLSDLDIVARSEDHGYVAYYTDYVWDKGVNDWSFDPTTGNLYVNYNFDGADADDYPWHSVRSEVNSVNIGSKVTKIGYEMFADCANLTAITIRNGVTSIGVWAFKNCSSLTSITIPASVADIQNNAFYCCTDLSSIVVNSGNARYRDVEDRALVAGDTLVLGCTSGYIPTGVTTIGNMAFCSRVLDNSTLEIPEGVTSIERYAFVECKVSSIYLPSTLKKCAAYAFCYFSQPNYITEIHIDDLATWFNIDFADYSNPLEAGADFYVGGTLMDETLTIPAGITEIKQTALAGWKGREVIISNGVTSIGEVAFWGCKNLTTVTIPSSMIDIQGAAFYECTNLSEVFCYAESVPTTALDAFEETNIANATLYVPAESEASYRNAAPWSDFGDIVGMGTPVTGVTLNKTAATLIIGETLPLQAIVSPGDATNKTVKWSSSNTSVATVDNNGVVTPITDGTATITATAGNCSATCTVTVKGWSFDEATGKLYVNYDYNYGNTSSYPWHAVRGQVESVEFGSNVTSIGYAAFESCTALERVNVTNKMNSIGEYAFCGCSALSTINIPDNMTRFGAQAFDGCASLTNITIPEGVETLEFATFRGCHSLANVTIPSSVKSIGAEAFHGCERFTNIEIPYGVESIGLGAFHRCYALESIIIPASVTSLGNGVFDSCTALRSITIPEGITNVGDHMFSGCTSLISVILPNSVEAIGVASFQNCEMLASITIPANVTEIKDLAFGGCTALKTVTNLSYYLDIVASETSHGYVAYYADKVWTRGVHLNESAIVLRKGEEYILEATVITEDTNDKTVTWQTNNDMVAPVANGVVTAFEVGTTIIGAWAAGYYETCNVTVYIPGDVNLDGMVLVDDIVLTINEVLTIDMENFLFEAADMDRDNQILVNDVTMVINTALGIDTYAAQRARSMARTTMTASQEGAQYSVSLSNATDYVAMQFDMTLPEGMNLDAIKMAEGNSHAVRYNLMENGAVRVVVASLGNEAFVANQLLSICVSGNDSEAIVLTNVCLSTREGDLVQLDDAEIEIQRVSTHIQPEAQATATADIYDLNGRLVKKNATSTEGLAKGVYLMNGKKITVK